MLFERYPGFASLLVIGSLLSLTDSPAPQKQFGAVIVERPAETPQRDEEKLATSLPSHPDQQSSLVVALVGDKSGELLGALSRNAGATVPPANPDELGPSSRPEPPAPLALPEAEKLSLLDQAYLDVFSILRENNECSRFYGGPAAIEALNELKRQLKTASFDRSVAVRMAGQTSSAINYASGFSYRLFEKAELNLNGSFYRSKVFPDEPTVPRVGEFSPNTREARATILLHEIGHLVKNPDKSWVLPNDGKDASLSRENTLRVIKVCRAQIRDLERTTFAEQLSKARASHEPNSQLFNVIPRR